MPKKAPLISNTYPPNQTMSSASKFLWVLVDSQGKPEQVYHQSSTIKSHCAKYRHRSNPKDAKFVASKHTAAVSGRKACGSSERPLRSLQPRPNESQGTDIETVDTPGSEQISVSALSPQCEQTHRAARKDQKLQEWRKSRCNRFRKVSIESLPIW